MALIPRRTPRAMAGVRATGLRELHSATHGDVGIISLEFLGEENSRYNTKAYVLVKEQKGAQKEETKSVFYRRQYLNDVLRLAGADTEEGFLVEATTTAVEHPVEDSTILKILNGKYRCDINAEDVTITYINGSFYTLEAKPDSLGYVGKATLSVGDLIEIPLIPTENALVEATRSILTSNIQINDRPYSITSPLVYDVENIIFKEFDKAGRKFSYFLNLNDVAVTVTGIAFPNDSKPAQANINETVRDKNKDFILSAFIPASAYNPIEAIPVASEFKVNTWLDSLEKLDRIFEVKLNSEVVKLVDLTEAKESSVIANLEGGVITFTNTKHQPASLELRVLTVSIAASEDPSFAFITGENLEVNSNGYEHYSFDVAMLAIPLVNLEVTHIVPSAPVYQALLERVGGVVGLAPVVSVNEANQVVAIESINPNHDNYQAYSNSIEIEENSKVAVVNIATNGFSFLDVFAIPANQWAKIQEQGLGANAFTLVRTVNGVTTRTNLTVNNLIARGVNVDATEEADGYFAFAFTNKGNYEATTEIEYVGELFLTTNVSLTTTRDLTARYIPSVSIVDQDRFDALKAIDGNLVETLGATAFSGNAGYVSHSDSNGQFVFNYQKVPSIDEIEEGKLTADFLVEVKIDSAVKAMLDEAILNYKEEDKDAALLAIKTTGDVLLEGVSNITYETYKLQAFNGLVHDVDTNTYSLVVRVKTNIGLEPDFNLENPADEIDRTDTVGTLTVDFDADTLYGNVFVDGESVVVREVVNTIAFDSPRISSPKITIAANQAELFASAEVQARISVVAGEAINVNTPTDHLIVDQTSTMLGVNIKRVPEAQMFWAILELDITEELAGKLDSLTVTRNDVDIDNAVFQDGLINVGGKYYFLERFPVDNTSENQLIYVTDVDGTDLVYVPTGSVLQVNISVIEPPSSVFIHVDDLADDDSQISLLSHEVTGGFDPIELSDDSIFDVFKTPLTPILGLTFEDLAVKNVKGDVHDIDYKTLVGVEFKLYITKADLDAKLDTNEVVGRIYKLDTDWSLDLTRQVFKRQTYEKNGDLYLYMLFRLSDVGGYNGNYEIEVDWDGLGSDDEYVINGLNHNSFYYQKLPFALNLDTSYLPRDLESPTFFWPSVEKQRDLYTRLLVGEFAETIAALNLAPLENVEYTLTDGKLVVSIITPTGTSEVTPLFLETTITDEVIEKMGNATIKIIVDGEVVQEGSLTSLAIDLIKSGGKYYQVVNALDGANIEYDFELDADGVGTEYKATVSKISYEVNKTPQRQSPALKLAENQLELHADFASGNVNNPDNSIQDIVSVTDVSITQLTEDSISRDVVKGDVVKLLPTFYTLDITEEEYTVLVEKGTITVANSGGVINTVSGQNLANATFVKGGKYYYVETQVIGTEDSITNSQNLFTVDIDGVGILYTPTARQIDVNTMVVSADASPTITLATNPVSIIERIASGIITPSNVTPFYGVEHLAYITTTSTELNVDIATKPDAPESASLLKVYAINLTLVTRELIAGENVTVSAKIKGETISWTGPQFSELLFEADGGYYFILPTEEITLESTPVNDIEEWSVDLDGVLGFHRASSSRLNVNYFITTNNVSPTFTYAPNQAELMNLVRDGVIIVDTDAQVIAADEVIYKTISDNRIEVEVIRTSVDNKVLAIFEEISLTDEQYENLSGNGLTIDTNGNISTLNLSVLKQNLVVNDGKYYKYNLIAVSGVTQSPIASQEIITIDLDADGNKYLPTTSTLVSEVVITNQKASPKVEFVENQQELYTALVANQLLTAGEGYAEQGLVEYTFNDANSLDVKVFVEGEETVKVPRFVKIDITKAELDSHTNKVIKYAVGENELGVLTTEQFGGLFFNNDGQYFAVIPVTIGKDQTSIQTATFEIDLDGESNRYLSAVSDLTSNVVGVELITAPLFKLATNQTELLTGIVDGTNRPQNILGDLVTPFIDYTVNEGRTTVKLDAIARSEADSAIFALEFTGTDEHWEALDTADLRIKYLNSNSDEALYVQELKNSTITLDGKRYFIYKLTQDVLSTNYEIEVKFEGVPVVNNSPFSTDVSWRTQQATPAIYIHPEQAAIHARFESSESELVIPSLAEANILSLNDITYNQVTNTGINASVLRDVDSGTVVPVVYVIDLTDEQIENGATIDLKTPDVDLSGTTVEEIKDNLLLIDGKYCYIDAVNVSNENVDRLITTNLDADGSGNLFKPTSSSMRVQMDVVLVRNSPTLTLVDPTPMLQAIRNGDVSVDGQDSLVPADFDVTYEITESNTLVINAIYPVDDENQYNTYTVTRINATVEEYNKLVAEGTVTLVFVEGSDPLVIPFSQFESQVRELNGVKYLVAPLALDRNITGPTTVTTPYTVDADGEGRLYKPTTSVLTTTVDVIVQVESPKFTISEDLVTIIDLAKAGTVDVGIAPELLISSDNYVVESQTTQEITAKISHRDETTTTALVVLNVEISPENYAKLNNRTKFTVTTHGGAEPLVEELSYSSIVENDGKYYFIIPVVDGNETKYENTVITIDVDGPGKKYLETGSAIVVRYDVEFKRISPKVEITDNAMTVYAGFKNGDYGTELRDTYSNLVGVDEFYYYPVDPEQIELSPYPAVGFRYYKTIPNAPLPFKLVDVDVIWEDLIVRGTLNVQIGSTTLYNGTFADAPIIDTGTDKYLLIEITPTIHNGQLETTFSIDLDGESYSSGVWVEYFYQEIKDSMSLKVAANQAELYDILVAEKGKGADNTTGAYLDDVVLVAKEDIRWDVDVVTNTVSVTSKDGTAGKLAPVFAVVENLEADMLWLMDTAVYTREVDGQVVTLNNYDDIATYSMKHDDKYYLVVNGPKPNESSQFNVTIDRDGEDFWYVPTDSTINIEYTLERAPLNIKVAANQLELYTAFKAGEVYENLLSSDAVDVESITVHNVTNNLAELRISANYNPDAEDNQFALVFYEVELTDAEYDSIKSDASTVRVNYNGANLPVDGSSFDSTFKKYNGKYYFVYQTYRERPNNTTTLTFNMVYGENDSKETVQELRSIVVWNVIKNSPRFLPTISYKYILNGMHDGTLTVPGIDNPADYVKAEDIEYNVNGSNVTITRFGDLSKKIPFFAYEIFNPDANYAKGANTEIKLNVGGVETSREYNEFSQAQFNTDALNVLLIDSLGEGTTNITLTYDVDGTTNAEWNPSVNTFNVSVESIAKINVKFADDSVQILKDYEAGTFPRFAPDYVVIPSSHVSYAQLNPELIEMNVTYPSGAARAASLFIEVLLPDDLIDRLNDTARVRIRHPDLTMDIYDTFTGTEFKQFFQVYENRYIWATQSRATGDRIVGIGFDLTNRGVFDDTILNYKINWSERPFSPRVIIPSNLKALIRASKEQNLLAGLFVDADDIVNPDDIEIEVTSDGSGIGIDVVNNEGKMIPLFVTFEDDAEFDKMTPYSQMMFRYFNGEEMTSNDQFNSSSLIGGLVTYEGKRYVLLKRGNYVGLENKLDLRYGVDSSFGQEVGQSLYRMSVNEVSIRFERTIVAPPFVATYQNARPNDNIELFDVVRGGMFTSTLLDPAVMSTNNPTYVLQTDSLSGELTINDDGSSTIQRVAVFLETNINDEAIAGMQETGRIEITRVGKATTYIQKSEISQALIKVGTNYYLPILLDKEDDVATGNIRFENVLGDITTVTTQYHYTVAYNGTGSPEPEPTTGIQLALATNSEELWNAHKAGTLNIGEYQNYTVEASRVTYGPVTSSEGSADIDFTGEPNFEWFPVFISTNLSREDMQVLPETARLTIYSDRGGYLERTLIGQQILNYSFEYNGKMYTAHMIKRTSSNFDGVVAYSSDPDNPATSIEKAAAVKFNARYDDGSPEPEPEPLVGVRNAANSQAYAANYAAGEFPGDAPVAQSYLDTKTWYNIYEDGSALIFVDTSNAGGRTYTPLFIDTGWTRADVDAIGDDARLVVYSGENTEFIMFGDELKTQLHELDGTMVLIQPIQNKVTTGNSTVEINYRFELINADNSVEDRGTLTAEIQFGL